MSVMMYFCAIRKFWLLKISVLQFNVNLYRSASARLPRIMMLADEATVLVNLMRSQTRLEYELEVFYRRQQRNA